MIRQLFVGAATVALASGPALAAPTTSFEMTAGLNAGWSDNPYLQPGGHSTGTLSATVAPVLTIATATGRTIIAGDATYLKYLNGYGDSRSIDARLQHSETFSPRVSGDISFAGTDTTSALLNPFQVALPVTTGDIGAVAGATTPDPGVPAPAPVTTIPLPALPTDIIASRQKLRVLSGSGDLTWQISGEDTASASASVVRGIYPGGHRDGTPDNVTLSNYWDYTGGLNVGRQISERTRVGVGLSATRTLSGVYPDGTSLSPGITLNEKLNAYWTLDAGVSLILNTLDLPTGHDHSTQAGFNLNLCGAYPHASLCFTGSRSSAPSGYGGLRTRLSLATSGSIQLSTLSSINGSIGYAKDQGADSGIANDLSLLQVSAGYSRTLTRRLSLNLSAGYQHTSYSHFGSENGASASAGLSITFGHGS